MLPLRPRAPAASSLPPFRYCATPPVMVCKHAYSSRASTGGSRFPPKMSATATSSSPSRAYTPLFRSRSPRSSCSVKAPPAYQPLLREKAYRHLC